MRSKKRAISDYTDKDIDEAMANGISYSTFYNRVHNLYWNVEDAKTKPVVKRYNKEFIKLAELNGISYQLFASRIRDKGWTQEKAATVKPCRYRKRKLNLLTLRSVGSDKFIR